MSPRAQLGGGTRGTRPHFFRQWHIICHVPHIFLFRFGNILVSHQPAPSHFTTKLRVWMSQPAKRRRSQ